MEFLFAAYEPSLAGEIADWTGLQVLGNVLQKALVLLFLSGPLLFVFIRRRRRWRKLFHGLRDKGRWRRRKKNLRVATRTLKKWTRLFRKTNETSFASGIFALEQAGKARDEATFNATLEIAERWFVAAATATDNEQAAASRVAVAVAVFYRGAVDEAVAALADALTNEVFTEKPGMSSSENFRKYLKLLGIKYEVWSFLTERGVCESWRKYRKNSLKSFDAWRDFYRKQARQSSGESRRRFSVAAKQAKKLRRTMKRIIRRSRAFMVLHSQFVDLRFAKKMQRVYRSIQEKELAVVAAEVYRNIFFLSIDGGDPPKVGWKNLAAFTLILLVVMAGFVAFIVGLVLTLQAFEGSV